MAAHLIDTNVLAMGGVHSKQAAGSPRQQTRRRCDEFQNALVRKFCLARLDPGTQQVTCELLLAGIARTVSGVWLVYISLPRTDERIPLTTFSWCAKYGP